MKSAGIHRRVEAGLEFLIFCLSAAYSGMPPWLVSVVLGIRPRALCLLRNNLPTELQLQPELVYFSQVPSGWAVGHILYPWGGVLYFVGKREILTKEFRAEDKLPR